MTVKRLNVFFYVRFRLLQNLRRSRRIRANGVQVRRMSIHSLSWIPRSVCEPTNRCFYKRERFSRFDLDWLCTGHPHDHHAVMPCDPKQVPTMPVGEVSYF